MKTEILTAGILAVLAGNITAFNDQTKLFTAFDGRPGAHQHGSIFAANDANFDSQNLSEPLTEFIVGAPEDEGLLESLDAIAPSIPVGRAFTYRTHNTSDQFQTDNADDGDIREIGGKFATVGTNKHEQVDARTDNKGLIMVLDNDQGGSDTNVQQRAVLNLRNRLLRSDLRRVLVALDANDTNVAKTWGSGNTATPDLDVLTSNDLGGDERGVDGNVVVWGKSAWIKRMIGCMNNLSPGMAGTANLSPAQAAAMCGAERGIVLPFRFQSAAATKTKVLGDAVFAYYAKQGAMADDPSNIKRFVTNTDAGLFRVYILSELKRTMVAVEHYSRVVAASTLGIRKLTIS